MSLTYPLKIYQDTVRPEWIDRNGHMNMGYYLVVFDFATTEWLDYCGLTTPYREAHNITTFAVEGHINYLREVAEGAPLVFTTHLIDFDRKRIHYIHEMWHATEGFRASCNELMSLHIDRETRRASEMDDEIYERLALIKAEHDTHPMPAEVGRQLNVPKKK